MLFGFETTGRMEERPKVKDIHNGLFKVKLKRKIYIPKEELFIQPRVKLNSNLLRNIKYIWFNI